MRAVAHAAVAPPPPVRRESYVERVGAREIPVTLAVNGDDYRFRVRDGNAVYESGRVHGMRWRADANGIAHVSRGDLQGDPMDRWPRSIAPFAVADCTVAGEGDLPDPAWVVLVRPEGDKPFWFYVDEASGEIVREVTRDGAVVETTTFSEFGLVEGTRRARRWTMTSGDRADDAVVELRSATAAPVPESELAIPRPRSLFTPSPNSSAVPLPARFRGGLILVDARVGASAQPFVLDSGTASILLGEATARRLELTPFLGHAIVARLSVGPFVMRNVSVLVVPGFRGAILGYDFFIGHVVHVDYPNRRVEIMRAAAAASAIRARHATVLPADVSEGLPLVGARLGDDLGTRFAVDTGSAHVLVLAPFLERYADDVTLWAPLRIGPSGNGLVAHFLEGLIAVEGRHVPSFTVGPVRFADQTVEIERAEQPPESLAIPFDGIIGTDVLRRFELWFDDDEGSLALRFNG